MTTYSEPLTLHQVPLFQGLTSEQYTLLEPLLHRKTFSARTAIVTVDQPGEVVYILLRGTVKIATTGDGETEVILAILGRGEVIGEMSMVDNLARSATVITQEETAVYGIARTALWDCIQTMPAIAINLTRILSSRIRLANAQIQALATLDVYGRVARQILAFAQEYGEPVDEKSILIPLRLTQSDFAGLTGASRVRVNHVLVSWKRRKYISVDRNHRITLHDRTPLARLCH